MDKAAGPVLLSTSWAGPSSVDFRGKIVGQQPLFLLTTCLGLRLRTATGLEKLLEGQ